MINHRREHAKRTITFRRAACFFLILVMALYTFSLGHVTAQATEVADTESDDASRAIAIVFDNSGTMYMDGNKAWSRAIYAMEVFTAMANEGDEIIIYPMEPITVDGVDYSRDGSTGDGPLFLTGGDADDVERIQRIYTDYPDQTPIESIQNACDGLEAAQADEKWLIVLTDGDYFHQNGEQKTVAESEALLSETLSDCATKVNLIYLGISSEAADGSVKTAVTPTVEESGTYTTYVESVADSADVPQTLTDMCNLIYGRNALDDAHLYPDTEESGEEDLHSYTVNIEDMPMKKLILFVQGEEITDLTLLDEDGNEAGHPTATYNPYYPVAETGNGRYDIDTRKTDDSLSGEIVIYRDIPAGTYTMQYRSNGEATSAAVYYEPNVRLSAIWRAAGTTNGDSSDSDEYTLEYGLKSGDDYVESNLMDDWDFQIRYTIANADGEVVNEASVPVDSPQGGGYATRTFYLNELGMEEGDSLDVVVEATSPSGYLISTADNSDDEVPSLTVGSEVPDYSNLALEIPTDSYALGGTDESNPIIINVTNDGEPLTPEEMEQTELTLDDGGLGWSAYAEKDTENSRFLIRPEGDGEDVGEYEITATVNITPENGAPASATVSKTIELYQPAGEIETEPDTQAESDELAESDEQAESDTQLAEAEAESETTAVEEERTGWLKWVILAIVAAGIVVLIALIAAYRNRKILPDEIVVRSTGFVVEWDELTGKATLTYTGGGEKTGSLTINAPEHHLYPKALCGLTMKLKAVDARKVESGLRSAMVESVEVLHVQNVDKYTIVNTVFEKDPETGNFVQTEPAQTGTADAGHLDINMSSNDSILLQGEVLNESGEKVPMELKVVLLYQ